MRRTGNGDSCEQLSPEGNIRFMAARSLSLREKRLIQAAILLAIIVLVSLLLRGGGEGATPPGPATTAMTPVAAAPSSPPWNTSPTPSQATTPAPS
jgi:hypothetical protein